MDKQTLINQIKQKQTSRKQQLINQILIKQNGPADPAELPDLPDLQYTQQQQDYLNRRGSKPVQAADNAFDAFKQGGRRGFDNLTQGVAQRVAQGLDLAGLDVSDFLEDQARTQELRRQKIAPTEKQYPVSTIAGRIAGEMSAIPAGASTWKGAVGLGGAIGGAQYVKGEAPSTLGQLFGPNNNPELQEFVNNVIWGGAFGGLGQKVGEGIANLSQSGAAMGKTLINKALSRFNLKAPDDAFTGGIANPKLIDYMRDNGVTPEIIKPAIVEEINQLPIRSNPEQASNLAEARNLGIEDLTQANITGSYDDMRQQRLLEKQGGDTGDAIRSVLARQNNQIIRAGDEIVKSIHKRINTSSNESDKLILGGKITESLRQDVKDRKKLISSLYEDAQNANGAPIVIEQKGIADAYVQQLGEFKGDPDAGRHVAQVGRILKDFGVMPKAKSFDRAIKGIDVDFDVEAFQRDISDFAGEESTIKELTIKTADELRKRIRATINNAVPKTTAALRPIINAIDDAYDAIAITDGMADEAVEAFKKARSERVALARDYEQKDIIQDIVQNKTGTFTNKIHPSIVYDKIMSGRERYKNIGLIKRALTDRRGKTKDQFAQNLQYWRDFKSTVAAELIGKGLTKGKTATGELQYSGGDFNKAMSKLGGDTLRLIFGKEELARLSQFGRVTRRLTVLQDGLFTPSGDHVENALSKISKLGFLKVAPVASVALKEGSEILSKRNQKDLAKEVLNPTVEVARELGAYSNNAVKAFQLMAISAQSKIREKMNEDK